VTERQTKENFNFGAGGAKKEDLLRKWMEALKMAQLVTSLL